MSEAAWYDDLRKQWEPAAVRLLLVSESAPDPGAAERRFFYAPTLDRRDNLFRGVVEAPLVEQVRALHPAGVIVCHAPTFSDVAPALRVSGALLLHDDPLPFPRQF